ncbi:unnamed protein product [Hermetia illucens]|uniref:Uncharacterized protein n=1 Tax=Hermetia illucens TaxID=343691 RepID=A0A7R8USW1_HERIL|nr:unnamed protein product [Hermetia illucens]
MLNKERNCTARPISLQESGDDDDFGRAMSNEGENYVVEMQEHLTDSDDDEDDDMDAEKSSLQKRSFTRAKINANKEKEKLSNQCQQMIVHYLVLPI